MAEFKRAPPVYNGMTRTDYVRGLTRFLKQTGIPQKIEESARYLLDHTKVQPRHARLKIVHKDGLVHHEWSIGESMLRLIRPGKGNRKRRIDG